MCMNFCKIADTGTQNKNCEDPASTPSKPENIKKFRFRIDLDDQINYLQGMDTGTELKMLSIKEVVCCGKVSTS